jgi:hypothetical protein
MIDTKIMVSAGLGCLVALLIFKALDVMFIDALAQEHLPKLVK